MNASNLSKLRRPAPTFRPDPFSSAAVTWLLPQTAMRDHAMPDSAAETAQSNHDRLMKVACEIGDHLVDTAIWSDDATHCTWLAGRDVGDRNGNVEKSAAIGPELYGGTAGVALFLHALHKITGTVDFNRAAIASWQRSVKYLKGNPFPPSAISFYAGDLGLLYVGYRLGYGDRAMQRRLAPDIAWLLGRIDRGLASQHSLDMIGGNAGAIGPLLFIANRYRLRRCREIAMQCANEIVNLGTWQGQMCIWAAPGAHGVDASHPPLTGLSNGAAGIGMALLEAYRETGHENYLTYANGAFAFEEQLFNPERGNWVDTRYPHYRQDGKVNGTFRGAWCHGAPGIALAHLRATRLNPARAQFHRDRLMSAITTTRNLMQEKMQSTTHDATLCQGVFGLSDVLLSYTLQESPEKVEECQNQVLDYLKRFDSPVKLRSGLACGGYSPSLMAGLSGIGLHLLRLAKLGNVPSVLLLDRETLG